MCKVKKKKCAGKMILKLAFKPVKKIFSLMPE